MSYSTEEENFFKFLRDSFFDPETFNKKIIKNFEKENYQLTPENVLSNTSFILQTFIGTGKNLWTDAKMKIESNWINVFQKKSKNVLKFPSINKQFINIYKTKINSNTNIKKLHNQFHKSTSNIFSKLCYSNTQFAKNLAGKTFELHIQNLLNICDYKFERQQSISKGQILDFVYPSLEKINSSPSNCIVSECQSTLKDRFRLSLGKIPPNKPIKKYIFTGSGLNIITNKDKNDLTKDKINEIKEKGWTLVVFNDVKIKKFNSEGAVISYENFFNKQYPAISGLWD